VKNFDAQLQDLYKQLANTQPQVESGVVKNLIANAAYEKIDDLKIERSQLLTKYTLDSPIIGVIDSQTSELESLIHRNKF